MCSSPKLIAAYHVLHRLSDPRHSPYTLNCFKNLKCILSGSRHCINATSITTYFISQYVKELKINEQKCKYADVQMILVDVMALNQQPPLRYTYKLLKELVFYLHICPLAYLQICFGGGYRSRTDDPPDMLVGMHLSN